MKEAIVKPGTVVQLIDSPIPVPNADQIVVKVVCAGCNPKGLLCATAWRTNDILLINSYVQTLKSQNGLRYQ